MGQLDYSEFRKQYAERHPASVPQFELELNEYPKWVRYAVMVTFVSVAMVSGIHTVPTVYESITIDGIVTEQMRTVVSYASLFAIELGILLSAYLMAKGVKLAWGVMIIASMVAILANLYSVFKALGTEDVGVIPVAVALGIGAPMIALFTGKMFVDIQRADRVQDAKARKVFKEASIAWDKEVDRAYKSYLKDGQKDLPRPVESVRTDITDGQPSGHGFTRRTDAKDIVREHLEKNPQDNLMSVRELANLLGVGKSTVSDAKRSLMQDFSENGHSQNGHNGNGAS